jgi:hypothetical protein
MPREVPAALLLYLSSPSVCLALFLSGGMKGVYIGARRREQTGWTFQVAHQRYPFGQKKKGQVMVHCLWQVGLSCVLTGQPPFHPHSFIITHI